MDFDLLEDFLAVIEHGSILAAAEATGTSQPTLSRKIRDLEDSLGVLLFNRTSRGVSLTVYGTAFQEHANKLLQDHQSALEGLSALKHGTQGHARIGLAPALSGYLPIALNKLQQERPEATFEVLEGTYDTLVQRILKREIDGGLTMLPPDESVEALAVRSIGSEPVVIVADAKHPLGSVSTVDIRSLTDESWILMNRPRSIIDSFYQLAGAKGLTTPKVSIETSSLDFLKSMVKHSTLLTALPKGAVHAELSDGTLVALPVDDMPRVETVFLHRHGVLPPLVSQLVQEVQATMRTLQASDGLLFTR